MQASLWGMNKFCSPFMTSLNRMRIALGIASSVLRHSLRDRSAVLGQPPKPLACRGPTDYSAGKVAPDFEKS